MGGDPDTSIVLELIAWNHSWVNQQDHHGRTPLHDAAQRGHLAVITLLFKNKADANIKDVHGRDPLHLAIGWREEDAARLIFDNIVSATTSNEFQTSGFFGWYCDKYTLLHQAAHLGHDLAVERLLESRSEPHDISCSNTGFTALYFAARKGHSNTVKIFLAAMKNKHGKTRCFVDTALHLAAKRGREETVDIIITANSASANTVDVFKFKPLHWAVAGGYTKIVRQLLPLTEITAPLEKTAPSVFQLAWWGANKELIPILAHHYDSIGITDFISPDFRIMEIMDALTKPLDPAYRLSVGTHRGIDLYDYYGLMQMRRGNLRFASAWLDVALLMHPINENVHNLEGITCPKKYCDHCLARPIVGPYFTCTTCIGPCYDLCETCYQQRIEIGHMHPGFLQVPAGGALSLSASFDALRSVWAEEIGEQEQVQG
jgi:hypothetical protein